MYHVAPIPGFMGFAVPEMKGVPDAFAPMGVAQRLVVFEEDIFLAYYKDDLEGFKLLDEFRIIEVWDILTRHVVVDVLVAEAVEEVLKVIEGGGEIITAAEADDLMEEMGVFEC